MSTRLLLSLWFTLSCHVYGGTVKARFESADFDSRNPQQAMVQIRIGSRVQFIEVGGKLRGTPYTVKEFNKKTALENGLVIDASEAVLENLDTMQKVVLPLGKVVEVTVPD